MARDGQEAKPKVVEDGDGSKAFDANQLADLVAQKVWEAMPKMVRLDYETKEALNEYARGKRDGAKEEHERAEKEKPGRHVSDQPMELRRVEVWERVEEAFRDVGYECVEV
jgi:hypothetical protein